MARAGARWRGHVHVVALVTLFTKADCHLCEEALSALEEVRVEIPFALEVRDIRFDEELHRAYFERIPVVSVDGEELCEYFLDAELLRERLQAGGTDGAGARRPPSGAPRPVQSQDGAGGQQPPSGAPRPISY